MLTTASGLTLYRFTQDPTGKSACTGVCAKVWPPLTAAKGDHVQGPKGVKGLSVINVGHGRWQVAFHNVALYRFAGDKKKGQAHGQGVANVWFAALKSGIPAGDAAPATSTPQPSSASTPAPAVTPPTPAPTSVDDTGDLTASDSGHDACDLAPGDAAPGDDNDDLTTDERRGRLLTMRAADERVQATPKSVWAIGSHVLSPTRCERSPYVAAMPTIGAFRCWPPMEPKKGASPKVKMPPSAPWSQ